MLSRKEAANRLKISVRTLDRHIRRGCFDIKRSNRSVWISEPSFERYYQGQTVDEEGDLNAHSPDEIIATIEENIDNPTEVGAVFSKKQDHEPLTPHEHDYQLGPANIYKNFYEELKDNYDEQVKRLEGAHYRVGQLEAQVKSMVPLIEFKKERKRLLLMDQQYKDKLKETKYQVKKAHRLFESERLNKNVYVALVYGLLALQPVLWVLIQ